VRRWRILEFEFLSRTMAAKQSMRRWRWTSAALVCARAECSRRRLLDGSSVRSPQWRRLVSAPA